jgi:hypothetical protein
MYTLHFQDSQVARVSAEGADLHIALSSAAVSVAGDAAQSSTGYLAPVRLVLQQASWQGELRHSIGRLSGGELILHTRGIAQRLRMLSLPCELGDGVNAVELRLDFANGTVLQVKATILRCGLNRDAQFTESYAC